MNTSILLAITFFATVDTATANPAHKTMDAVLTRCETSSPQTATIAVQDGKRVIVFQSQDMAVEVRAPRHTTNLAANFVGGLASRVAEKKSA